MAQNDACATFEAQALTKSRYEPPSVSKLEESKPQLSNNENEAAKSAQKAPTESVKLKKHQMIPIDNHDEADLTHHQPKWFREALERKGESRSIMHDGARVHYWRWKAPNRKPDDTPRPGLLFVHGNGAHGRWFDFIAPLLSRHYNVAAIDLPGMGDSEWRDSYDRNTFGHAIGKVALDAELGPRPVIVGHSFGGFTSLIAAGLYGEKLGGLVLCDFLVKSPETHDEWFLNDPPRRPTRIYPDYETAANRFRLAPPQDCTNRFVVDYIGSHSLREVKIGENPGRRTSDEAGWTWKFDPFIFDGLELGPDLSDIYAGLPCPTACLYGARSFDYRPSEFAHMRSVRPQGPISTIANAHHHLMLDQPHAFASAVEAIMANWEANGSLSE
ncbi:MAG: alpha/beta hydrolase [Parvibaculaceae bacterium]|nr:alpha/beta hydrolase [Parvibaculaceae bacterium]